MGGTFQRETQIVAVTNASYIEIHELACEKHEEAVTRIIAHIAYCASVGFKRVVVACTDTDIIMLYIYHLPRLSLEDSKMVGWLPL